MASKKSQAGFWLSALITFGFVGWAIYSYDFSQVGSALASANYWWVVPAAIIEGVVVYIRVVRWHYFLEPIKKVSHYNAAMATFIGFTANMLMPARLGEFLRAWLLGKRENISKSAVMGTVVIERAIDGITMVLVAVMVLVFTDVPDDKQAYWATLETAGYLFGIFFVIIFIALYLVYRRVAWIEWIIDRSIGIIPNRFQAKVRQLLESFRQGFDFLGHSHHIIGIALWSFVFWSVAGGLNIMFFHAFGLGHLPFIATYLILVAQVIGVMIPSPGFVGPYHAATIAALAFYNVEGELALSMAIVMHATMFITNVAPGLVFLWMESLSLSGMRDSSEAEED